MIKFLKIKSPTPNIVPLTTDAKWVHALSGVSLSFMKLSSYTEMASSGQIRELIGLNENVFNREVIIIEDIVDTGHTMKNVLDQFNDRGVKSVEVVSLLIKPEALVNPVEIKYVGFEIPDKFVVGYGLDYDGFGRNSKAIYQLKS